MERSHEEVIAELNRLLWVARDDIESLKRKTQTAQAAQQLMQDTLDIIVGDSITIQEQDEQLQKLKKED